MHKSNHPHHPHLLKRDHRDGRDRDPQNAHINIQSHELGTRSEVVTPEESRAGSRRESIQALPRWEKGVESRVVKDGEVKLWRERSALRAAELRNAIMGLNTLSNNTTRRLDNTYYGVLEKLSVLQSTILSMKELASMTRQLNEEFKRESKEVTRDVEIQLDGFSDFEEQEKRIRELQERVVAGREQIITLGARVDLARQRVDGWEKAEGEWQEKTRKRLRILWILMAVIMMLLLGLMGSQYSPTRSQANKLKGANASSLAEVIPELDRIGNKSGSWTKTKGEVLEKMLEREEKEMKMDEDSRLRLFDEL